MWEIRTSGSMGCQSTANFAVVHNGSRDVVQAKEAVHVADLAAKQSYVEQASHTVRAVELGGVSNLSHGLLKENELVGTVPSYRQRPFTNKQIELVENRSALIEMAMETATTAGDKASPAIASTSTNVPDRTSMPARSERPIGIYSENSAATVRISFHRDSRSLSA
jgi:hypothetical protein